MSRHATSALMSGLLGLIIGLSVTYWPSARLIISREQTPRAAIEVVNQATALINKHGFDAFDLLDRDASFNRPDTYIFILAADGTAVYHAADRTQVGESFANLRDIDQRPFGLRLITDAAPEGVWSSYRWQNPATGQAEWKLTYTRQSRQGYIVGAGIYGGLE